MEDYVVMPKAHWQDTLDAVRDKSEKSTLLRSGDVAAEIRGIEAQMKSATGTFTPTEDSYADVVIEGLGFTPKYVVVRTTTGVTANSSSSRYRLIQVEGGLRTGSIGLNAANTQSYLSVGAIPTASGYRLIMNADGFTLSCLNLSYKLNGTFEYIAIG